MKTRILLIGLLALALAVLPLMNAQAQQGPWYYCSATRTSGGSGTYYDPWACSNDAQLTDVTNTICRLGGGSLYRIFTGYYQIYYINYSPNGCSVVPGGEFPGYPPNTGPDIPMPLIIGGVVLVGLLLIAGGLLLRRNKSVTA